MPETENEPEDGYGGERREDIRALRQARDITQKAFAEQLHVTRQAVSNWETGASPIKGY